MAFNSQKAEPITTIAFEMQPKQVSVENAEVSDKMKDSSKASDVTDPEDIRAESSPPDTAVEAKQQWNHPKSNMWRVFACFFSFLIVGANDGSYGPLILRYEDYYHLNYTIVSLVFLSPFVGYSLAAIANNTMHTNFGQRGIAVVGPACHLISFIILSIHPPYPVLVVMYLIVGFGNGLIDAAWCAWLGNMAKANQVSGFLQACYSLGATIAPLISSLMFSQGGLPWYSFYYIMVGGAAIELLTSATAFWKQTGQVYQAEHPRDPDAKTGRTREALKNKLTWVFALFIFGYVGAEVSLGGWIVQFMTKARSATPFVAGATTTGFWAGMTVGRIGLSFLTERLGEFRSVILYISVALALELLFWLVPSLVVSAIAVAFLGMALGPLFATAIVLTVKLMPKDLHVGSVGFATAFGGSGGAVFPFIVGAIAQSKGVKSLQPVILGLLTAIALLWLVLPRMGKKERGALDEKENEELKMGFPTWKQMTRHIRDGSRAD